MFDKLKEFKFKKLTDNERLVGQSNISFFTKNDIEQSILLDAESKGYDIVYHIELFGGVNRATELFYWNSKGKKIYSVGTDNVQVCEILNADYSTSGFTTTMNKASYYTEMQLTEIHKGITSEIDIFAYDNENYTHTQMEQLRLGLELGLNIEPYSNVRLDANQMFEIRTGIMRGLDIDKYLNIELTHTKMQEIRSGLENDLDVTIYNNPKFTTGQMKIIKMGLIDGLDVRKYANPKYNEIQMDNMRLELKFDKSVS